MSLWFVIACWIISVGVGLYAATRVHNTRDFAIAGRHLPFYMVTTTVFATWSGSETVRGIPATLSAPSVTFSENILKPMLGHKLSDRHMLHTMRGVTLAFTVIVTLYAMNSKAGIFKMVENAYQITLVMAFVPLVAGLFWKRSTTQGMLAAIFCGLSVWLSIWIFGPDDPFFPAQFAGVIASANGMVIGSLLPSIVTKPLPHEPEHAGLHHLAASHTEHVAEQPPHHYEP